MPCCVRLDSADILHHEIPCPIEKRETFRDNCAGNIDIAVLDTGRIWTDTSSVNISFRNTRVSQLSAGDGRWVEALN